MIELGACYYDHFVKFLREPADKIAYRLDDKGPAIQILRYQNVFKGCDTLCSLGLGHHSDKVGVGGEVCMVVDSAWRKCGEALANLLFHMIEEGRKVEPGVIVTGLSTILPDLAIAIDKEALFVDYPTPFPNGFHEVCDKSLGVVGRVYWVFPITQTEAEYAGKFGVDSLESALEAGQIDPFCVSRKSATL